MLKPPTSLIASLPPSNNSGWLSTSQWAPKTPPASSSATNASTTSRGGCLPWRTQSATTASVIASMSFMSTAPRPHRQSSRISPANGSICQSLASAGTTSRCPWISSAGREESAPGHRASTDARPGADSSSCGDNPQSVSRSAAHSAAARSSLVGLDESIRMRSRHRSTTSSSTRGVSPAVTASAARHAAQTADQRPELSEVDRHGAARLVDGVTLLVERQRDRQVLAGSRVTGIGELREVDRDLAEHAVLDPRVDGHLLARHVLRLGLAEGGATTRHRGREGLVGVVGQLVGVARQLQMVAAVVGADLGDRHVLAQQTLEVVEHFLALRVLVGLAAGLDAELSGETLRGGAAEGDP